MSAAPLLPGSLAASVAGAAWAWALAVLLGAAVARAGASIGRRGRGAPPEPRCEDAPVALCVHAVLGCAAWAALALAASTAGLLRPAGVLALATVATLVGAAVAGRQVLAQLRAAVACGRDLLCQADAAARVALAALAAVPVLASVHAIVPTLHYDDLVYHLGLPRQALLTGAWPAETHFHHAMMPASWEALFLVPLALGGGVGPQLMNVVALAGLGIVALTLAQRGGGPLASAVALTLLLASGAFMGSTWTAGNDLAFALALACALHQVLDHRWLMAGACAGAALGMKLAAAPGVVALGVVALAIASPWPGRLARAGAFAGIAVAVAAPWWIRALVLTGNPLYPALPGVLGGHPWDATAAALLARDSAVGAMPGDGPRAFVTGAWHLLAHPERLGTPAGSVAVFALLVAGGLALRHRGVAQGGILLAFTGLAYAGWCATSLMERFFLAPLIAVAPFAVAFVAIIEERVSLRGVRALLAGVAVVALVTGWLASLDGFYGTRGLPAWSIVRDREGLVRRSLDLGALEPLAASELPAGSRLLLVAEARVALIPFPARASTALDPPLMAALLREARGVDDVPRLLAPHATHVLVNKRERERWIEGYGLYSRSGAAGVLLSAWLASQPAVLSAGAVDVIAIPDGT